MIFILDSPVIHVILAIRDNKADKRMKHQIKLLKR